jgi:hypothetical protein
LSNKTVKQNDLFLFLDVFLRLPSPIPYFFTFGGLEENGLPLLRLTDFVFLRTSQNIFYKVYKNRQD